jgi:class 3 adenylate cyclase
MPNAEIRRMPGLAWTLEELPAWIAEIRDFIGAAPPVGKENTVLATTMFTDIVASTARQAALGDRAWKDLIARHHAIVRDALTAITGQEIDTAGDGFFATFDGASYRCPLWRR